MFNFPKVKRNIYQIIFFSYILFIYKVYTLYTIVKIFIKISQKTTITNYSANDIPFLQQK